MKHPLSLLALACSLAACSAAPTGDADKSSAGPAAGSEAPAEAPASDAPGGESRLTVYSGDYEALATARAPNVGMPGYALVERPLRYTLKSGRNALSWEERFELDVWYVEHHSFWLDVTILARTVRKVIAGDGISQPGHDTADEFRGSVTGGQPGRRPGSA